MPKVEEQKEERENRIKDRRGRKHKERSRMEEDKAMKKEKEVDYICV